MAVNISEGEQDEEWEDVLNSLHHLLHTGAILRFFPTWAC